MTPVEVKQKNCSECKYAIFIDHGYSNYTVEGTDFKCAMKMHPDGQFDKFYDVNPKLFFAEQCTSFTAGPSIEIDVDGEAYDNFTTEQQEIMKISEMTDLLTNQTQ